MGNEEYGEQIASILSEKENGQLEPKEAQQQIAQLTTQQWDTIKFEFAEEYHFIPVSVPEWELCAFTSKDKDNE